ncbi:MAG: chloride channel protein [Sphingomonadales bacterium]|nr:chloride channel protein [Sphingomonadales bacterium]
MASLRLSTIHIALRARRWLRGQEAALIPIAALAGAMAGLMTRTMGLVAHAMQHLLFGVGGNRLSALAAISHPAKLLALPLGGLVLMLANRFIRLGRVPIDVVEANALHGGRLPIPDTLVVCAQTLISNGFGASVGLEAAYTQAGGGIASWLGRRLGLRREDLRTLVGAGAGAAIGSAFGAPLSGAFYGFEIVIGAYTPAAMAPVAAAALAARLVVRVSGGDSYLVSPGAGAAITALDYGKFAALGLLAGIVGVAIMRLQTIVERAIPRIVAARWRPVLGGVLLMPIAWITPQALSSGHGALRLDLILQPAMEVLAVVFALKVIASVISLSFGFRGGLFFASLFLGSLLGPLAAQAVDWAAGWQVVDPHIAALVGMAALAVTIVGGPMCLSLLVLETTHDFALTGVVITAALTATAYARTRFGYSFSTWRLHLRGTGIRSARDQGWLRELTARRMMDRAPVVVDAGLSIGGLREAVPLGATGRVLLAGDGAYRGMVITTEAYDPGLDLAAPALSIAHMAHTAVAPTASLPEILDRFEDSQLDELAVVDEHGGILGTLTEKYVRRRHAEEMEKQQAHLFGEG